ncbi:alpha/beta hydrolase family protein [Tabrizicola sp.]|uniref:alpha/beta hydrolase family protein n=1 Tax=Tabrizicola sp. TaxID=2005166 RepID=UPI003F345186
MTYQHSITADHTATAPSPVLSLAPLTLAAPARGQDLQLRVSAPATGSDLPIILFSHGNGQSLHGYDPLVHHWAAQGFAVLQPTHLDSRMLGLAKDDPRRPDFWRFREADLVQILDSLAMIEEQVPAIRGRLDVGRIAVAGHSWGAQTASMLLGATHPDPRDGSVVDIADRRVKAGVLFAVPGTGGKNLSAFAAENFPFMQPEFSGMTTPTLVVAGDNDHGAMTVRGPDWWREAYDLSPDSKSLFTVFGGEHSLGGIANYEARETTDENPDRVAAVQRLTTAYLKTVLSLESAAWDEAVTALGAEVRPQGKVENKYKSSQQREAAFGSGGRQPCRSPRPPRKVPAWRLRSRQ